MSLFSLDMGSMSFDSIWSLWVLVRSRCLWICCWWGCGWIFWWDRSV